MATGSVPTVSRTARGGGDPPDAPAALQDASLVQPALQSGEKLRWTGRPGSPWLLAFMRSWQHFLFSFLLIGVLISPLSYDTIISKLTIGGTSSVVNVGLLLVGIAMLLSPIYQYLKALRTIYAITDKRGIILFRFPWHGVQSFYRAHIETIQKSSGKYWKTSLIFRTEIKSAGEGVWQKPYGFYHLVDGNTAEQWLQRIVADGK